MPITQDSDFWWQVGTACYYAAGLPVAWWHMRREGVSESDLPESKLRIPRSRVRHLLILVLAALWPVLLLAFAAAWFAERADRPRRRK